MRSGSLRSADVEFYLSYTTQIYDFASKYDWESLLDFDYQYRERQAEHSFVWGAMTTHMELQLLKPKVKFHSYRDQGFGQIQRIRTQVRVVLIRIVMSPVDYTNHGMEIAPLVSNVSLAMILGLMSQRIIKKNGK